MVNHGQRYCSWARTHDGDDNGGVAQDGGHKGIIKGDHLKRPLDIHVAVN